MTEKILKTISFEIKEVDEEDASFWATASTDDIDRDGDTISPDAWNLKNYKKNPVIPLFHDYRRFPVAKANKIRVQDGKLLFKPQFAIKENPEAKIAYDLYKGGYMNAFSVGFMPSPDGWEEVDRKDGKRGRHYTDIELLEISAVLVPSNQNALAQARSKGIDVDRLIEKEKESHPIEGEKDEHTQDGDDVDTLILKPAPEVTENEIRIRVRDPGDFVENSFRTITLSESQGIRAIIGKLKSDPNGSTKTQSYRFDKDKWTVAEAQRWVNAHKEAYDLYQEVMEEITKLQALMTQFKKEVAEELAKVYLSIKELQPKPPVEESAEAKLLNDLKQLRLKM